jgi:hypothetical protein
MRVSNVVSGAGAAFVFFGAAFLGAAAFFGARLAAAVVFFGVRSGTPQSET